MKANDITLIMCSWERPWYIEPMMQSYMKQTVKPKEFIIWNNNPDLKDELEGILKDYDVNLYHHDKNIGGFGRFYAARDIAKTEYVLFVDDDWSLFPNHIEHLNKTKGKKRISGLWCWRYINRDRARVIKDNKCDYIGTCGMISPRKIYDSPGLYKCPEKYWFIEDIWLSFYAKYELGIDLISAGKLEKFAKNMNRDDRGNLICKLPGLSSKVWKMKPQFVKYLQTKYIK